MAVVRHASIFSINSAPTRHANKRIAMAVPRSKFSLPTPNSPHIIPSRSTPTLIDASPHSSSSSVASMTPCRPIFVVVTTTPHRDTSTREHSSGSSSISNSPPSPSEPTPAIVTFGIFASASAARTATLSASNIDPRSHAHVTSTASVQHAFPGRTHSAFRSNPPDPDALGTPSTPSSSSYPSLARASRPKSTDSNILAYRRLRFSAASRACLPVRPRPPSPPIALASTRTTTRPSSGASLDGVVTSARTAHTHRVALAPCPSATAALPAADGTAFSASANARWSARARPSARSFCAHPSATYARSAVEITIGFRSRARVCRGFISLRASNRVRIRRRTRGRRRLSSSRAPAKGRATRDARDARRAVTRSIPGRRERCSCIDRR